MNRNAKTTFFALTLSVASVASLSAASSQDAKIQNIENRLNALEQKKGASGVINPSGRFGVVDGANLFIYGDALLLNATETGLGYAALGAASGTATSSTSGDYENTQGHVRNQNMDWHWGFRVGAGYNMCHDCWDVNATYFRFTNEHTNQTNANLSGANYVNSVRLPSTMGYTGNVNSADAFTENNTFKTISANWDLSINQLDVDLGRMFYVSKFLRIRPHAGLRTDWLDQDFKTYYISSIGNNRSFRQKERNHFWGMGVLGGLNTLWGLGGGWSIYADAAVSLLYGHFNLLNNTVETTNAALTVTNRIYSPQKVKATRAITDLALGLRWDRNFDEDRFHIGFNAGWEQHIYFGQNQLQNYVNHTNPGQIVQNNGDLTLQGFAFGARFDF